MKKTLIIAISLFICSYAASLHSQSLPPAELRLNGESDRIANLSPKVFHHKYYDFVLADPGNKALVRQTLLEDVNSMANLKNAKLYMNDQKPKEKSMLLGIALSALLPGAGEFYAKSYLKAAIFFGVEALSWGTFAYFTLKGDRKTEDYQNYAGSNWSVRQYAQWLVDHPFEGNTVINPNEPNLEVLRLQINECERENFTHTLPEYGSQQYYELIGKYQNFVAGWADAKINGVWIVTKSNFQTSKTKMFNDYSFERGKANDFYSYANTGIIVVILNHILSAADAAWAVSVYNKKIKVETGMDIKRYRSPFTGRFGSLPSFNMRVSF
jgi:hypothetical protein